MNKEENIKKIKEILDKMTKSGNNLDLIDEIKQLLENGDLQNALAKLQILQKLNSEQQKKEISIENDAVEDEEYEEYKDNEDNEDNEEYEEDEENYSKIKETADENDYTSIIKLKKDEEEEEEEEVNIEINDEESIYPKSLLNTELEKVYLGLMLINPKAITMYYFLYNDCLFSNDKLLDIYKSIIFTEGGNYASEEAKLYFNFSKSTKESNKFKLELRTLARSKKSDLEKVYIELKKLFMLRKYYIKMPIKETQDKIAEIRNYALYSQMTVEEIESAINQIIVTAKFKQSILNKNVTDFLLAGENSLTTGIALPFPILSSVFKGMRRGETMAFAMPSNAGKSRFTLNLVSQIAFVERRKVLVISNEMSEEKMKLCLITTIINNPRIQELHGQKLVKSEGELLDFKFRPDKKTTKTDKDGFIVQKEGETRKQFVNRLHKESEEFRKTVKITEWVNKEINNSIYFINITDHTNDELKKVISNFYYKEKIEYMFYDTMKTDTENIGNSEEIKKTATILSNLAQNLNIFIGYTMQLAETQTDPMNLTINDLSVSRTVKEVLDTLCLVKQISNKALKKYEYSLKEVDTKFYNLKEYKDPDERYYACVVDKNRAGSKPKVLFNLNLAYNRWVELGYLKLKDYEENN